MPTIEQLVDKARMLMGEMGAGDWGLLCAMLLLVIHCIVQFSSLCFCFVRNHWHSQSFYPDDFLQSSGRQREPKALPPLPGRIAWPSLLFASRITSPTRTYQVGAHLANGDLCEVRRAQSEDRMHVLKIPRVSAGDGLLAKEQMVLQQIHERSRGELCGDYFPLPIESFRFGDRLVSAFAWRDGFLPAREIWLRHLRSVDGRHLAWMFNRILETLGFVHRLGWIHGAVLPPHLLFHPSNHGLQLIGWIHAERSNTPLRVVSQRFKAWYPPECHRHKAASPATDIYLAAQSMIWLAGGNPLAGWIPNGLPIEIRRFLLQCLLESPSRRPQDAWTLRDQFRDLLEDVYGSPQFCHLDMS